MSSTPNPLPFKFQDVKHLITGVVKDNPQLAEALKAINDGLISSNQDLATAVTNLNTLFSFIAYDPVLQSLVLTILNFRLSYLSPNATVITDGFGNFVSGSLVPTLFSESIESSAPLTLTTSFQDIANCSFSNNPAGAFLIIATGEFVVAGQDGTCEVDLSVNGTRETKIISALGLGVGTATQVLKLTRTWLKAGLAPNITIKLQAKKSAGAGASSINEATLTMIQVA